jgi:hypothetical protein
MWVSGLRALGSCGFVGFPLVDWFDCSYVLKGTLCFCNKTFITYKKIYSLKIDCN